MSLCPLLAGYTETPAVYPSSSPVRPLKDLFPGLRPAQSAVTAGKQYGSVTPLAYDGHRARWRCRRANGRVVWMTSGQVLRSQPELEAVLR